jgi:hypothetical protein
MPPRSMMTISVLPSPGAPKATFAVSNCDPSAATPTAPAPATIRRRVKPPRHFSFCAASSAVTTSAWNRSAASALGRPVPQQFLAGPRFRQVRNAVRALGV